MKSRVHLEQPRLNTTHYGLPRQGLARSLSPTPVEVLANFLLQPHKLYNLTAQITPLPHFTLTKEPPPAPPPKPTHSLKSC
jgi:hypothetical protein